MGGDLSMEAQAVKKDAGKPMLNLVPLECLEPLARVREFAVTKYGRDGIDAWQEISDERLLAALLRHLVAYQKDHNALDEESGLPAIYHAAINAMFLAVKTMDAQKATAGVEPKIEVSPECGSTSCYDCAAYGACTLAGDCDC